jgi:hypothetical protein
VRSAISPARNLARRAISFTGTGSDNAKRKVALLERKGAISFSKAAARFSYTG